MQRVGGLVPGRERGVRRRVRWLHPVRVLRGDLRDAPGRAVRRRWVGGERAGRAHGVVLGSDLRVREAGGRVLEERRAGRSCRVLVLSRGAGVPVSSLLGGDHLRQRAGQRAVRRVRGVRSLARRQGTGNLAVLLIVPTTQDPRGQLFLAHQPDVGVHDDPRLQGREPHVLRVEALGVEALGVEARVPVRASRPAPAGRLRRVPGHAGQVGPAPVRPPLRVREAREGLQEVPHLQAGRHRVPAADLRLVRGDAVRARFAGLI